MYYFKIIFRLLIISRIFKVLNLMLVLCAEVLKLICIKFILIFNIMGINTFSILLRVPKLELIDNVILLYYVTPKKTLPTSTTANNVT